MTEHNDDCQNRLQTDLVKRWREKATVIRRETLVEVRVAVEAKRTQAEKLGGGVEDWYMGRASMAVDILSIIDRLEKEAGA